MCPAGVNCAPPRSPPRVKFARRCRGHLAPPTRRGGRREVACSTCAVPLGNATPRGCVEYSECRAGDALAAQGKFASVRHVQNALFFWLIGEPKPHRRCNGHLVISVAPVKWRAMARVARAWTNSEGWRDHGGGVWR
eukprot:3228201-Pyramimonas_sp.AAC.1